MSTIFTLAVPFAELGEPEDVEISKLHYSDIIAEAVREIYRKIQKNGVNLASLPLDEFGLDARCNLFRGKKHKDLEKYLDEGQLEISDRFSVTVGSSQEQSVVESVDGETESNGEQFPYWVYKVPSEYTGITNALRNQNWTAYHRAYLETPDGIVSTDIGEIQ